MQTRVKPPHRQRYPQPAEYYADKISAYVNSHDHGADEAIADILARYQAPASKAAAVKQAQQPKSK